MLLETLDIKKDDVIIYSQNLFDIEKNFKIIYKDDPQKEPHKINFAEVCRHINEFTPQNIVVYRVLTNIRNFEIYLPRYGFFMNINDVTELIYFDPIFAVKEIEEYSQSENYHDLRFRIQQVGLTTLNRKGDLPNYAEIYSVDLMANEAKFQNDKVFADAIFAFSKNVKSRPIAEQTHVPPVKKDVNKTVLKQPKELLSPKSVSQEKQPVRKTEIMEEIRQVNPLPKIKADEQHKDGIRIISHDVAEDKDFDYKKIMRINFRGASSAKKITGSTEQGIAKNNNVPALPKLPQKKSGDKSEFGKFLEKSHNGTKGKNASSDPSNGKKVELLNIFKSPASLNNFLKERENKPVVLKLDKK